MNLTKLRSKPQLNWYVFYTKSRCEKKAETELRASGKEVFLPIITQVRQWSDRKKKVQVPLFNSYVFIKCREHEMQEIIQWNPYLVAYVKFQDGPAIVNEKDLELIKKLIETGIAEEADGYERLGKGDPVKVLGGPLKGMEGEVIEVSNRHQFVVRIDSIQQGIKLKVPKHYLKPLSIK